MAVEADGPKEAMKLAKKFTDEYITERDFDESEVDVTSLSRAPEMRVMTLRSKPVVS